MKCPRCGYVCVPIDHDKEGGQVWACERCLTNSPVKPEDEELFWQAMDLHQDVECQLRAEEEDEEDEV